MLELWWRGLKTTFLMARFDPVFQLESCHYKLKMEKHARRVERIEAAEATTAAATTAVATSDPQGFILPPLLCMRLRVREERSGPGGDDTGTTQTAKRQKFRNASDS